MQYHAGSVSGVRAVALRFLVITSNTRSSGGRYSGPTRSSSTWSCRYTSRSGYGNEAATSSCARNRRSTGFNGGRAWTSGTASTTPAATYSARSYSGYGNGGGTRARTGRGTSSREGDGSGYGGAPRTEKYRSWWSRRCTGTGWSSRSRTA